MRSIVNLAFIVLLATFVDASCDKDNGINSSSFIQIMKVSAGGQILYSEGETSGIPINKEFTLEFSAELQSTGISGNILLLDQTLQQVECQFDFAGENKTVLMRTETLEYDQSYSLVITDQLKGIHGESFHGATFLFHTEPNILKLESSLVNNVPLTSSTAALNIDRKQIHIEVSFNEPLVESGYQAYFTLSGTSNLSFNLSADKRVVDIYTPDALQGYTKYVFTISPDLKAENNLQFDGFSGTFITSLDSTIKFPLVSDNELLTLIQQQTFKYFWDFAHPVSGMIRERNTSGDIVTSGGSGFGLMAIIVGMNRGFISREEGIGRLDKIISFLESSERFHGAWPHWLNGSTGSSIPFSTYDNGADIVETSYLVMGLLTFRQYLDTASDTESLLTNRINKLWQSVEWNWFTKDGENVLYWHWSPDYFWKMNLPVHGYNEALITYILGASSNPYSISKQVYDNGWAENGGIKSGKYFYNIELPLGSDYGGPMFFSHYTYLGVDPHYLSDNYGNYWEQCVAHASINYEYCKANPHNFMGYGAYCWGLTASDNQEGYSAHSPTNDLGVITPSAAVSSLPFVPDESMAAIRHFYYILGDRLWGSYGFYDAFNVSESWWANSYIAIDQGPIIIMIENYRSGLLWDLFMSCPEVRTGLDKLEFNYE